MNVVILRGTLSSDPVSRDLASGSVLVSLELTTTVDEAAVSVPVAWFDPGKEVTYAAGDALVVTGTVRRRFYASDGRTQSRTEVVAIDVVPASRGRSVAAAIARALRRVDEVAA